MLFRSDAIKQKIAAIQSGLPKGVQVVPFYDRTQLINRATHTLKRALIEELLLVTLAHIIFLAHFRSILIVTIPLPLAVLLAFLFMYYAGISSNLMSLSGIAIAIGVLVDAGIVVTEKCLSLYGDVESRSERSTAGLADGFGIDETRGAANLLFDGHHHPRVHSGFLADR